MSLEHYPIDVLLVALEEELSEAAEKVDGLEEKLLSLDSRPGFEMPHDQNEGLEAVYAFRLIRDDQLRELGQLSQLLDVLSLMGHRSAAELRDAAQQLVDLFLRSCGNRRTRLDSHLASVKAAYDAATWGEP